MQKFLLSALTTTFCFLFSFSLGAQADNSNDFALRINSGGSEVTYDDEVFIADAYFDTGTAAVRPQTGLPEPYQSFRFSRSQQMAYDIPVPDGEYTVNLYFAELWFGSAGGGAGGVGSRVFDVTIEGQLAEDNLDVFATVGADAMLIKTHTVTVTGGVLDIDFDSRDAVGGERHPIINAIEILGLGSPTQRPFVTTWKTDNPGASEDNQITIPTHPNETYDYLVDWGDGTSNTGVTGDIMHTYETAGTYQVSIFGDFPSIFFNDPFNNESGDADKILSIDQWGDIVWQYVAVAFAGCDNLDMKATDVPDFSNIVFTNAMFLGCSSLVGNETMNSWDFGSVISMNGMFNGATLFNQDLGEWDVSNVADFGLMFSNANSFDQDIGRWNVGNGTTFNGMFAGAISFDQNLENWNVGNAQNMGGMFSGVRLSLNNYDDLLTGWSNLTTLQNGVQFDAGESQYCEGEASREKLMDDFGWVITDGGKTDDCPDTTSFITTWKTDNPGGSTDNQITIPTYQGETYNYSVDWGDGTSDSGVTGDITHTYATPGTYQVSVSGVFPRIYFNQTLEGHIERDYEKIVAINQWGDIKWTSMDSAFDGCSNLDLSASDLPDLSLVTSLQRMFANCSSLVGNNTIADWDISGIDSLDAMFQNATLFNQNIGSWDVSNVLYFGRLFDGASSFNQDIGNWDVSRSYGFNATFYGASSFNQDISNWTFENAIDLSLMFAHATSFNQDIGSWNVSNIANMNAVFSDAPLFNQDIGGWDVSNVVDMDLLFYNATAFNQDLSNWDVGKVTYMGGTFRNAQSFDQDLGSWNVSQVQYMNLMFEGVTLSLENYDSLLNGWSTLPSLQSGLTFDAGNSQYCQGEAARQQLIDDFGWTIMDGGLNCSTAYPDEAWLEAECAQVGANWNVINDASSSGGAYAEAPAGQNLNSPPSDLNDIVTYNFLLSAGSYNVFGLVQTPSGFSNSFWVRANGGTWVKWNSIPTGNSFGWHQVWDDDNGQALVTFNLVQGANTIEIAHREAGTLLDKLYITKTGNIPNGLGGTDPSCVAAPQDPIADAGPDQNITLPTNSITLNGSGNDPDGGSIIGYLWTQQNGPNMATLTGATSANLTAGNLIGGTYTFRLTVTDDENDTGFDDINVFVSPAADEAWLEAECAQLGSNWGVINDIDASRGAFTEAPAGQHLSTPPTDLNSMITFNLNVSAGIYNIFGLVKTPSGFSNSFWVRVNNSTWVKWNSIPSSTDFVWHRVWNSDVNQAPVGFGLADGDNTITFAHREAGAGLDKIYVTEMTTAPVGFGEPDQSCTSQAAGKLATVESSPAMIQNAVRIYPNPTSNIASIRFEEPVRIADIMVFDTAGRLIRTYKGAHVSDGTAYILQVNSLRPGTYFVKMIDEKGTPYQKRMAIK